MITTYDFVTKTFGHASMLVGGYEGAMGLVDISGPLKEIEKARKRYLVETEKERKGEPFDLRFVYGMTPSGGYSLDDGHYTYVHVGGRLWRRELAKEVKK